MSLYYANGDSGYRNITVRCVLYLALDRTVLTVLSVNGGSNTLVDEPDSKSVVLSVPVKLTLNNGANTLTFGATQTNYAADLDKIIVYTA